jgi:hypothetical protein
MATSGWITMIIVLVGVWGGFTYFLIHAARAGGTRKTKHGVRENERT